MTSVGVSLHGSCPCYLHHFQQSIHVQIIVTSVLPPPALKEFNRVAVCRAEVRMGSCFLEVHWPWRIKMVKNLCGKQSLFPMTCRTVFLKGRCSLRMTLVTRSLRHIQAVRNIPKVSSLLTQKYQSSQSTTSQIKECPGLMGLLCSRVALRGTGKLQTWPRLGGGHQGTFQGAV